ncbi:patatin-like phospholipase family protein [Nitrospira sp. NS4]|uniref:patatin-like phospholipase family protein n=1 Tax=Nitrospira sp. NS4 TaxID=3414498 RepID=UPI003C2CF3EE
MARPIRGRRPFALFALLVVFGLLQGCSYVRPTPNQPLDQWDPEGGYRFRNLAPPDADNTDGLLIIAAFSGGGTRASTLAFGALRELASQQITWEGKRKRLLDELDLIFALSGGTFTAGYYVLHGDRIFHDFESRFLRKDWESELKARVFTSPGNWIRLWSPYFGRAHLMAELLDESLFEGATYGDLIKRNQRPWLLIHASDMATLSRFEFVQYQFDMICSDLSRLPIAWASASSAALPLVLSPISLKNYAGQCGYPMPPWLSEAKNKGGIAGQRANELLSYQDIEKRPNIHLLDGGLSDNLALRGLLESSSVMGGLERFLKEGNLKQVRKLVVLSVNAETSPDVLEYRSDHIPAITSAMGSMVDLPINRYSFDTITLLRMGVEKVRLQLRASPRAADSPFASDADVYFINAGLSEVADPDKRRSLMKIPTTLYLTDPQIDQLLLAASRLIRDDPEFQRLMRDLETSQ